MTMTPHPSLERLQLASRARGARLISSISPAFETKPSSKVSALSIPMVNERSCARVSVSTKLTITRTPFPCGRIVPVIASVAPNASRASLGVWTSALRTSLGEMTNNAP